MSDIQKFRKAMNGFNRHDVVTYIEYMNNKHRSQVTQLNNQLQAVLNQPKADTAELEQLRAENEALKAQCQEQTANAAALEEKCQEQAQTIATLQNAVAELQGMPPVQPAQAEPQLSCTEQELEAYRRAERAERLAMERARQTKEKAVGVLAEATTSVQISAAQLEDAAKTIAAQLEVYKTTVLNAGNILSDTAASLGAIAPEEE